MRRRNVQVILSRHLRSGRRVPVRARLRDGPHVTRVQRRLVPGTLQIAFRQNSHQTTEKNFPRSSTKCYLK